jgi:hypothetical protein
MTQTNQKSISNLESFLSSAGLYIQLFPGVFLSDLIRIKFKEDLSINLVQSYLQFISESEFSFKYSPESEVTSARAILLFPNWRMSVVITDSNKTAFLIGKDWSNYNLSSIIPSDIQLSLTPTPASLHMSYFILSIARLTVLNSPDCSSFPILAQEACHPNHIEDTIQEVIEFIYTTSLKPREEIENYLTRYQEIIEQDSLNYSSSDELSLLESIAGKTSKMSDWVGRKMKNHASDSESSIVQFDTLNPEMNKKNPFDLASSCEDKSSIAPPRISVDDIIDSAFVNSLLDLGNKRKTIIMQIDEKPESCQCGLCPIY